MKLGTKIGGGFGIVIIIALAIGIVAWLGISTLNKDLAEISDIVLPSTQNLLLVKAEFQQFKIIQGSMLDTNLSDEERIAEMERITETRKIYGGYMKSYEVLSRTPEEEVIWKKFQDSLSVWKIGNDKFFEAFREIVKTGIMTPIMLQRDIEQFTGDHYKLEVSLLRDIFFNETFKGGDDSTLCRFGKWMAKFKTSNKNLNNILSEIKKPHNEFHTYVHEIKNLLAKGGKINKDKAEKLFTEKLNTSMEQFFGYFGKLKAEANTAREYYKTMQNQALVICAKEQKITEGYLNELVSMNIKVADEAKASAVASAFFAKLLTVIALAVGILAGIIIAVMVTKSITGPVRGAVGLALAMADGDMTQRLEIKSNDEIGDMSKALNSTCEALSEVLGDIQDNSEALAAASEEMSAVASQLASGSEEMSSQSTNIAGATEQMSANIKAVDDAANEMDKNSQNVSSAATEIATSMNTVAAAVEEAQTNVSSMASASEEMSTTINEVAQNAQKANETTNNAVDSVNEASKQVGDLASAAQEIEQIISVIVDIAEQTKLLALNATIEAARAGEAGKGFAVVANEVKDLAKQTNDATEDIKKRVKDMQNSTSTTVERINNVTEVIQEVNNIVTTIAAAVEEQNVTMRENAQKVSQVAEGVEDINHSVSEVNNGVNDISKSITDVADGANVTARNAAEATVGAQEVAKNISGISDAAQDSTKGAQQLNATAEELAGMAASLQTMMAKFKVDNTSASRKLSGDASKSKVVAKLKNTPAQLPTLDDI